MNFAVWLSTWSVFIATGLALLAYGFMYRKLQKNPGGLVRRKITPLSRFLLIFLVFIAGLFAWVVAILLGATVFGILFSALSDVASINFALPMAAAMLNFLLALVPASVAIAVYRAAFFHW